MKCATLSMTHRCASNTHDLLHNFTEPHVILHEIFLVRVHEIIRHVPARFYT